MIPYYSYKLFHFQYIVMLLMQISVQFILSAFAFANQNKVCFQQISPNKIKIKEYA